MHTSLGAGGGGGGVSKGPPNTSFQSLHIPASGSCCFKDGQSIGQCCGPGSVRIRCNNLDSDPTADLYRKCHEKQRRKS